MPRKPRVEAPGGIQHVIARGNGGERIVMDDDDRRAFVTGLGRAAERSGWLLHAYCLMDTHLHAVVETPEPTLGSGMRRLLGGYAFEFNRRHARYGHLFAGPFTASLVETEAYAIEVCVYVVLNPVRAGLVRDPKDWKWGSYRARPLDSLQCLPASRRDSCRRCCTPTRSGRRSSTERWSGRERKVQDRGQAEA